MSASSRPYDVILYGATGFTGRLVAEYLATQAARRSLRWALAGRDRAKLEGVRAGLAARDPALAELPILLADARDRPALEAMAAQGKVVGTTTGPYARYGSDLVAACVAAGTDYCDLTGEVHWIRRMIDLHHAEAARRGVRIVHCCGFDSIPSDIGTFMIEEAMQARFGVPATEVRLWVRRLRGGFSGGTLASMVGIFAAIKEDRSIRRVLGDPYGLSPDGPRGPDGSDQNGIGRGPDGRYTAPFVMASVNTRIVRRSNALLGGAYGREFSYGEAMLFPAGPRGLARAVSMTAGLGAFGLGIMLGPTRALLTRYVLPKPGEGPSEESMARGGFDMMLTARGQDAQGAVRELRGRVSFDKDPGYSGTAVMFGEAALCLASGEPGAVAGGVLTPAAAMGAPLLSRLRAAGMTFTVEA